MQMKQEVWWVQSLDLNAWKYDELLYIFYKTQEWYTCTCSTLEANYRLFGFWTNKIKTYIRAQNLLFTT